jgi:hypothetical protein
VGKDRLGDRQDEARLPKVWKNPGRQTPQIPGGQNLIVAGFAAKILTVNQ